MPSDFHSYLCNRIGCTWDCVVLASLYVGIGIGVNDDDNEDDHHCAGMSYCQEDELLRVLRNATLSIEGPRKVQVLLDANQVLRLVSARNGEDSQSHRGGLADGNNQLRRGRALSIESSFHVAGDSQHRLRRERGIPLPRQRRTTARDPALPRQQGRWGVPHEGVHHGRQDGVVRGKPERGILQQPTGLVHAIHQRRWGTGGYLCRSLRSPLRVCDLRDEQPIDVDISSQDEKARKRELELSLACMFNGRDQGHDPEGSNRLVEWAIPTIQIPTNFISPVGVPSAMEVTRNMLSLAPGSKQSASVRLSSAYLNLTHKLLSVLTMYGKRNDVRATYILTTGIVSHGFASKKGESRRTKAGSRGVHQVDDTKGFPAIGKGDGPIHRGSRMKDSPLRMMRLDEIWITSDDYDNSSTCCHLDSHRTEIIKNPSSLVATVIGSSNYGSRSENLDLESDCILIFNYSIGSDGSVRESVADEWYKMCEPSNEMRDDSDWVMRFVLKLMRRYL
ncbi:hypothetical protein ACHAW5_002640 [Stephanodiscus triporus]|uniref:CDP-diacylglycerol--glycerol-3-phosphate 3-phosphatidyltransferase n=1 Tax=Stephanodiscus triporus TaxID=2934178 RepID=A0ABD3NPE8_9STRA